MGRYSDVPPGATELSESEDDGVASAGAHAHKAKPRRKSHQRPQGSDQIRQAFSKRKKGLVLKAYQLCALTDAKVFMFIVNDKGSSWAYATPGFSAALDPELLREMRLLARVPDSAKVATEVMTDPLNAKAPELPSSCDQANHAVGVHTTRTATGSLPTRSRSSYSWGSEGGHVPGSGDRLVRTASNAVGARPHSSLLQSDEHSPTKPRARPPSGSSMAGGARHSHAGAHGGHHKQQAQAQQPLAAKGAAGGLEPPTPSGPYNLLGQPVPGQQQDSPTLVSEVAMSCGSPSSKPVPPALHAAAAAAQLAAAGGAGAHAGYGPGGYGTYELLSRPPVMKLEPHVQAMAWQQQQQQPQHMLPHELPPSTWDAAMFQHAQAQQYAVQQQQQQQAAAAAAAGYFGVSRPLNIPARAGADGSGMAWGSLPTSLGLCGGGPQPQQMQMLPQPGASLDAFESMQRGLPPLRLARAPGAAAAGWHEPDGARSAPAPGVGAVLGRPSQYLEFGGFDGDATPSLRVASEPGLRYGAASSYGASPSSYTATTGAGASAGDSGSPMVGAGLPAAAQAFRVRAGSVSADPSPTALLSQRMGNVLAMHSPAGSPVHPSMLAAHQQAQLQQQQQQQQQQLGGYQPAGPAWPGDGSRPGTASGPPSSNGGCAALAAAAAAEQQAAAPCQAAQDAAHAHNQGSYMPRTDDLVCDPIMDMLMDKPMGQLGSAGHATPPPQHQQPQQQPPPQQQQQQQAAAATAPAAAAAPAAQHGGGQHGPQLSIMEATLQQAAPQQQQQQQQQQQGWQPQQAQHMLQQQQEQQQQQGWQAAQQQQQQQPQPSNLLQFIPPPPKSEADRPAWQAQVLRVYNQLQPAQRAEFVARCQQQMLEASGAANPASSSCSPMGPPPPAPAGYAPRGLLGGGGGGKQRHGPSRLSASSPAIDAAAAAAAAAAAEQVLQQAPQGQGQQLPAEAPGQQQQAPVSAGYVLQAEQQPQPGAYMPCCSEGLAPALYFVSSGLPAGSVPLSAAACFSGCGPQSLPMPLPQAQPGAAAPRPALAEPCTTVGSPFTDASSAPGFTSAPAALGGRASEAAGPRGGAPCSSPLKRHQPGSFGCMLAKLGSLDSEGLMSPLKRVCTTAAQGGVRLPEPPSFATLLQTELGEDDAVAWAASAAANDSLRGTGSSVSLCLAKGSSLDSMASLARLEGLVGPPDAGAAARLQHPGGSAVPAQPKQPGAAGTDPAAPGAGVPQPQQAAPMPAAGAGTPGSESTAMADAC